MSATDTYSVVYKNDVNTAIANLERYILVVRQAFKVTEDLETLMKRLGRDTSFLTAYTNAMNVLARSISDAGNRATRTSKETAQIGADTTKVEALAKKVAELTAELAKAEAQAKQTKAAAGNVGPGGGGGQGGGGQQGGAGGVVGQAVRMAGGPVGRWAMSAARQYLSDSRQALAKGTQTAVESSDKTQDFRESRREIAQMMGQPGVNDKVLDASMRTMETSGMSSQEEAAFTAEYYGSAATGRTKGNLGPGMNDAQRDKLEQEIRDVSARIAVQKGMDPKTAGDLAGVVSQYMPINSAADVAGQIDSLYTSAQEGRGAVSPMIQGMMAQAPMAIASGHVSGLPELGAFIGMGSTFSRSAKSSGVTYSWLERALNRQSGSAGAYLDRLGVKDKSSNVEKLELVAADLAKVQGDKVAYLQSTGGVGSAEDARALMAYSEELPTLKKNIAKAKLQATKGGDAISASLSTQSDPNVKRRLADARLETAEIRRGKRSEGYLAEFAEAQADLVGRKELDTTETNRVDALRDQPWTPSGMNSAWTGIYSREERIVNEVYRRTKSQFAKAGVSGSEFDSKYGGLSSGSIETRSDTFERAMGDLKSATENLKDAVMNGKATGQPPAVFPMRPGG